MKKIFMLLVLMVLLTGCSANVNISITSNNISEEIIINAYSDSDTTKDQVFKSFRSYIPVFANVPLSDTEPDTKKDGVEYYARRTEDLGSGYKFKYSYRYKFDDYKNSRSLKFGFNSSNVQKNPVDKQIVISTEKAVLNYFEQYPTLETVTVNIESSYKMINNNADFVNRNTYTWVFRKGVKKSIYLVLEDPNAEQIGTGENGEGEEEEKPIIHTLEEEEESEFIKFVNEHPILVAFIGILAFFIIVLILLKINKIKY